MKKLHNILISILFTMFSTNSIAIIDNDPQINIKYWSYDKDKSEIQKIQELIHGQYENEKFEVMHKPMD